MRRSIDLALVLAVVASCLMGCAPGPAGSRVTGEVTFRGKPLEDGSIQFAPAEGQGTFSGGPVIQGRYEVTAERGLAPGKYDVRILANVGEPSDAIPGEGPAGLKPQPIPPQYNFDTTLTAEIDPSVENKFDFHIP
jgi:hypothetical protein